MRKLAKKEAFEAMDVDIARLAESVKTHLAESGFEIAFSEDDSGNVPVIFIQARKKGLLRTTTGTRRSTDIRIEGTPGYFEVSVGTGEWGNNIIASAPPLCCPDNRDHDNCGKDLHGKKIRIKHLEVHKKTNHDAKKHRNRKQE